MKDIRKHLDKIEKQLHIDEKPHLVVIGSMKMNSDEFRKLLEEIDGNSKGKLPSITELQECPIESEKSIK
jgi:hypothetical protein